jgi:histidinol dehydrogenase
MFDCVYGIDHLKRWMSGRHMNASSIDMALFSDVSKIKGLVQSMGDAGVIKLTQTFDGVQLSPKTMAISLDDCRNAYRNVDEKFIEALKKAAHNIEQYHLNQRPEQWENSQAGRTYGVQYTPLDAVGLYVPGGRAAYPSSVLMTAIPAKIAGCRRIAMVSPPTGGKIPDSVLVAADISGVTEVYQMGGAQAVFALAYGTESVMPVDKIVGPGNRYVTAAKQMVYGTVDIDKPAGPSEVCVAVDNEKYAAYAASELLAQLEHDPDASAVGLVVSASMVEKINDFSAQQFTQLKRKSIIEESKKNAVLVVLNHPNEFIDAINYCASEHLVLMMDDADKIRKKVTHAGSIFCGPYTPVALGDYFAGPNHVLPTARSARFSSPLGVMDFMKYSSYLTYSKKELNDAAPFIKELTHVEGFDAHYSSIEVRINDG